MKNFLLLLGLPISRTIVFTRQLPPEKKDISAERLLRTKPTFSKSVMVSVGVLSLGATGIYFVEPGVKINGEYYRNKLLKNCLLPDMKEMSELFIFQQDGAPASYC